MKVDIAAPLSRKSGGGAAGDYIVDPYLAGVAWIVVHGEPVVVGSKQGHNAGAGDGQQARVRRQWSIEYASHSVVGIHGDGKCGGAGASVHSKDGSRAFPPGLRGKLARVVGAFTYCLPHPSRHYCGVWG